MARGEGKSMADIVKIGGGLAFFDDSLDGFDALLDTGIDYIVCDYLAEVTMSFLALDKAGNPDGYSPLFLSDMRPYLKRIFDSGTKLVTNWGGLNPQGAAAALQALARELGCNPKIGVCEGDNLAGHGDELRAKGLTDMFNGRPLPDDAGIGTMNAYLGGFPIAAALDAGADVVITGRVVDSALTLGALIHEFGWQPGDHDLLAAGTLCGHLLECSTQTTGGTFTDWASVPGWENIGKPIAECSADGSFILTKPEGTGGLVSQGTVAEQMSAASAMAPGCGMNMLSVRGTGAIPLMRLFSFLVPKRELHPIAGIDGDSWEVPVETGGGFDPAMIRRPAEPPAPDDIDPSATVPLVELAWARSGDKGDLFNVGVFARRPEYAPYIAAALSTEAVRDWFVHFIDDSTPARVDRYLLPGSHGLNFVVHNSLDGGGSAGRRLDRLAKGMGQILLEFPIPVSAAIAEAASADQARREIHYAEVEGAL